MLTEIKDFLNLIQQKNPFKIIFSGGKDYKKVVFEFVKNYYYVSFYTQTQVFNKNILLKDLEIEIINLLNNFTQVNVFTKDKEYQLKKSKKGKLFLTEAKNCAKVEQKTSQNRIKNRILEEGVIQPLIDMGIFTKQGKVITNMQDKYKQINRILELIDDKVKLLNLKKINIIDFGCGKSYLIFIVFYYFKFIKNIDINMIGLDLKEDVIKNCNASAQKYGYKTLKFVVGDIKDYKPEFDVDMVISLHACDTATDYAIYNAIKWGAKMIFSVPCCQHELNSQFNSNSFNITNRYGIAKERISAIYTDIIRCNLLKYCSYNTELLEFIDLSHTPKNLLIRAILTKINEREKQKVFNEVEALTKEFNLNPTLLNLLKK